MMADKQKGRSIGDWDCNSLQKSLLDMPIFCVLNMCLRMLQACLHEYPLSDIPAKLCSPVCEIEGGPVWLLRQFAVSCCPVIALEKQPC
jgi:hypothetical protein